MTAMHERLERILDASRADACMAIGSHTSSVNLRWANNTSTTNGAAETEGITVVSIIDGRMGVESRSSVPDDAIEDVVRASEAACEGKPVAHDLMDLIDGSGTPRGWGDEAARTPLSTFSTVSHDLAAMFARASDDDVRTFGYAEIDGTTVWLATSSGVRARHAKADGKIEITGKSADLARSSWVGRVTSSFDDVDVASMYERLRQRLAWSERTVELPAGHYEVILEPGAVADMALYAYGMSAARDADQGRTVFSKPGGGNRIGERLYAEPISMYSDPNEPGFEVTPFQVAAGSSSFASAFDNGLPLERTQWVRDGRLESLITPRYWAEKSGTTPRPFIPNLLFDGGADGPTLDAMIARTERALLVTCLWYIRVVDPQTLLLTGLTRDGVFLIEDGDIVGAVNNFRFNMSPVTMFANVAEVGRPEATLPREFEFALTRMPALRIRDWHMSSVSEAR